MQSRGTVAEAVVTPVVAFDFESVFRRDYARIARLVARVIADHGRAEDLAVEAFWRLWQTPRAHGQAATGQVYRTALRLALDELRRRERRTRYEALWRSATRVAAAPDEVLAAAREQRRVRAVLASVPIRDASLLLLRTDGCSYDEIASTLAVNPASIGTLLARAREAFRKEYVRRYGEV